MLAKTLFFVVAILLQIRVRVDLVTVPVAVRDNNGNLVSGLQKSDFAVFEDGKEQTLANFSNDVQKLSVAIVVDVGMRGSALNRMVTDFPALLGKFNRDDEIALFRYEQSVVKLSDFTNDPTQIQTSFGDVVRIADARPPEATEAELDPTLDPRPGWLQTLGNIFKGATNGPTGRRTGIPTIDQQPAAGQRRRVLHSAVYEAATALRGRSADRRKLILVISDGSVDEPRPVHTLEQNRQLLQQTGTQVFAVSTGGALLEGPFGALAPYGTISGGDVYGGRTPLDLQAAFDRIPEEAHNEYVLGYVSTNLAGRTPVYRKIEVRSGDPDQGRKLMYRPGYWQAP